MKLMELNMNIRSLKKANLAAITAATAVLSLVATNRSASSQALPGFFDSERQGSAVPFDQDADSFRYGTGVYRGQPAIWSFQDRLGITFPSNATGLTTGPSGITSAAEYSNSIKRLGELRASFSALPLSFELNQGQTNDTVKFLARAEGYHVFLTPTEAVIVLDSLAAHVKGKEVRNERFRAKNAASPPKPIVRMRLVGGNPARSVEGLNEVANKSNYFGGPDPAQWHTNIPSYARVIYRQVYPGIDMIYYGSQRELEYDLIVAAGADPALVQVAFTGTKGVDINAIGDLVIHTSRGDIKGRKPEAYQYANGVRHQIAASYIAKGESEIGFRLGDYDASSPLIIDPVLVYSSYLGGNGFDQGYAIAVDSLGSAYVTGKTATVDFPITPGAFQTEYEGGDSAFISKLNPEGTALIYSTYLNGASGNGIAVDGTGNAYVTGEASTPNFPITPGAFHTDPFGFDTFITKLNPTGSALVYSSRFGGNFDDFGRGIALDAAGNAYITGWTVCRAPTCTFPTVNAFQPNYGGGNNDAFVSKINSSGSALLYSTYLGGGSILNLTDDWGEGIAVDGAGSAYVTGYTYSPDFPVTPGAYAGNLGGLAVFVTKFSPSGTSLVYSSLFGSSGQDQGRGVAVDATGNAYVTGNTDGSNFPVTLGAFQTTGTFDAFVTKFNPQGSALVYSTYLGGSAGVDRGWAIAVDVAGNAYIAGDTGSGNFPTADPVQAQYGGGLSDAFVTKLNPTGSALVYSTFLGGSLYDDGRGIALNGNGDAFAIGTTSSNNFPTANPLQPNNGGGFNNHDDSFVSKLGTDSGGGIPCGDLRSFQARCQSTGSAHRLQAKLTLTDTSHSGEKVTITVDDRPFTVTINGNQAQLSLNNASLGQHTIVLTDPAGCFPPRMPSCE
jgi:hypothetical protein